jgi:hypothetical protein
MLQEPNLSMERNPRSEVIEVRIPFSGRSTVGAHYLLISVDSN